mgnify:FL=1
MERTTIKFPLPIKSEEIQNSFFGYLEQNLPVSLRWTFSGYGYGAPEQKKYLDKINLNVSQRQAPFIFAAFEFQRGDEEDYFDAVRLSTPAVMI